MRHDSDLKVEEVLLECDGLQVRVDSTASPILNACCTSKMARV